MVVLGADLARHCWSACRVEQRAGEDVAGMHSGVVTEDGRSFEIEDAERGEVILN
jgi:hypothetical protein